MIRYTLEDWIRKAVPDRVFFRLTLWRSWYFGQPELRRLKDLVPRRGNSVDVGANRGLFSHVLSGLSHQVYAYEPNPKLARFMRQTAPSNVQVFQQALSDCSGEATLNIPVMGTHVAHQLASLTQNFRGETRQVQVPVSSLDSAAHTDVAFVKIDVEGHEREVLEGAVETIREFRPTLLVEIEQRHSGTPVMDTVDSIRELGYDGCFVSGDRQLDVSRFSFQEHQERHLDPGTGEVISADYVNNFIFSPREE